MLKNYLKIALGILIPLAIMWTGYYLWQTWVTAEPPTEPVTQIPTAIVPDLPAPTKLTALTENTVFDYWLNSKTGALYYLNLTGQIIKKVGNTETAVNSQTLNKLNSVKASPDGMYIVAKFNYPNFPTFSIFNTTNNSWQPLPEGTRAIAWSPNSQQLAYLDDSRLKILNVVSQKTQTITTINQKDSSLTWLDPSEILLLISTPSADIPSSLWSINLKSKTLKPLIRDEMGLVINWSKNGDSGIKLNNINLKPKINLIDNLANVLQEFNFVTLPEKCALEENKIYCGVPKFLRSGLVLPDDYYKKAVYFKDDLYLIDLITNEISLLYSGDETLIDARHLILDGGQILFINQYDDRLYSLQL